MKIILIAEDQELRKLCREIVEESERPKWHLTVATPEDCPPEADLYIWDDNGRIAPPAHLDQASSKHLFVVHQDELSSRTGLLELQHAPAILTKPVTRPGLAVLLRLAALAAHDRDAVADSLRADRDEILQCLIQANQQIQMNDQDRANFLARAVHDLRTPLMTASGYCGLLLSEELGPENEEQKEALRRTQHSLKRLNRLAAAIFSLSAGKQGKKRPEAHWVDVRECAEQALQEIAPLADGKRISISVDVEKETGPLLIESGQIELVLINILESACKFTPKAGEIEIRGYPFYWERSPRPTPFPEHPARRSHEANSYRFDIQDSAPRIPKEDLSRLFEECRSFDEAPDRSGGGLGLALCKMILTAHGGHAWAENSEGGTRFCLILPLPAEGTPKEEDGVRATVIGKPAEPYDHNPPGSNGTKAGGLSRPAFQST